MVGYSEKLKNLALAAAKLMMCFTVSGEKIGGSYRLFRNDVGKAVVDNQNSTFSGGLSLGGPELGGGNY